MAIHASASEHTPQDTLRTYHMDEIIISSPIKETNELRQRPSALTLISPQDIRSRQVDALKDLSSFVPNFYMPDYGAKLTSAIYIRGVGARSGGQSVAFYVDGVPYMDKSTFDFELTDLQRIEVLRGPQGTIYGRNAMGGIVKIYTLSPFDYQGTRFSLSVGNHGQRKVKLSHYALLSEKVALSASAYYDGHSGFYTNTFKNEKADKENSAGGRIKLEARLTPKLHASYSLTYDYTSQGAFPYSLYNKEENTLSPISYNDENSYQRNILNNHLQLQYTTSQWKLTSTTGYQFFNDNMWMDQDFTSASIFTLNQKQRQHAISQEFALKNQSKQDYQWSFGLYGFYSGLKTDAPVTFKEDGIKTILQPVFNKIKEDNPKMPFHLRVVEEPFAIPGTFKTPAYGVALFHESTYNNLFTEGLSLTAGIRLDYEKQQMHYLSTAKMRIGAAINKEGPYHELPIEPSSLDETIDQDFLQLLPKVSLKYQCTPTTVTYLTLSKGYKAGGYNVQMSADVMQAQMQYDMMSVYVPDKAKKPAPLEDVAAYKPEQSWNYEFGFRSELIQNKLKMEAALYYMDVEDIQLTQFTESGGGRMLTNAGKAHSYGAELSLFAKLTNELSADINYGYTHATFKDYDNGKVDYAGKNIPYTPRHTANMGLQYNKSLRGFWIDQVLSSAQVSAIGPLYWTEENNIKQPFYATLNARIGVRKNNISLYLWGRNLSNTKYNAFYFNSMGKDFVQQGKPLQAGIEVEMNF